MIPKWVQHGLCDFLPDESALETRKQATLPGLLLRNLIQATAIGTSKFKQ